MCAVGRDRGVAKPRISEETEGTVMQTFVWARYRLLIALATVSLLIVTAVYGDLRTDRPAVGGPAGPDVFGGYPSTHVVVRVVPGITPVEGFARPVGFGHAGVDTVLANWNVEAITPTHAQEFGNPGLAAAIGLDRYYIIHVPQKTDTPKLAADLAVFGDVFESAQIDGIGGTAEFIPNDSSFDQLWGMHNTGQSTCAGSGVPDADIDAPDAWDIFTGTDNIILAVIDSGVNPHPEIASKLVPGWNTNNNSGDTSDGCDHGTHVSGTAGAIGNNEMGVAGVSFGVLIMPIRVLSGCGGNETQCANGVIWAADHGANIGTMSLQYYTGIDYFRDAIQYGHDQGMLLIAATGNSRGRRIAYPAKFPLCMGIGATTTWDTRAGFSNYGPEIDVSAPGQDVYSLLRNGGYACYSGTSMATPHVSGLASLIWSFNRSMINDEVEQILKDTVDDLGDPGWDEFFGHGRINAFAAILAAEPGVFPTDLTVIRGLIVSGGLPDLFASDDSYLAVQQGITQDPDEPPVWLELTSTSPTDIPTEMTFVLEAKVNTPAVTQTISLYNYDTGEFEEVDSRPSTMGDSVVEVSVDGDPARFVNSETGEIKAELTWMPGPLVIVYPWMVSIDQAIWRISE